jgi:hypothetical protein
MKKVLRSTDRRLVGAAVVSGLLLVPLGVFGSSALAHTASGLGPSAAQYQYKVTICHHTGSRKHRWHLIRIGNRAFRAHLRHGDTMPPCPTSLTTTTHEQGESSEAHTSSHSESHGSSGRHHEGRHGKS